MNVLAANAAGRKNRPRCGSARRKLREEREAMSTQPTGGVSGEERRVYQPGGAATASATTSGGGRVGGIMGTRSSSGLGRHPEVSLRALHSAKDEEANWKSQDEARWVEAEQLVTALKESKDEPPPPKPVPTLHAKGQVDKLIFAQPSMNNFVNEYKYR